MEISTIVLILVIYAVFYTVSKIIISGVSLWQIKKYTKKYPHIATEKDLKRHNKRQSGELPKITIVAPAYNEGLLIIDTVKSYLNQTYRNTEVIVASDGGSDDTLEQLINNFELYEVNKSQFNHSKKINHKPIKKYFRSKTHENLIVLDKINGGKADAQNAGIAIANGRIVTIIDADSVLENNALIHLLDIFEQEKNLIGIGTPIGVLNDCKVGADGIENAEIPKSFWARIQVLEYLRSFLLGRMAIQKIKGLLIVSGAFGVYQRWILEEVGGYAQGSLAEDMDIDCKIWRYLSNNKYNFKIKYIPEVFAWSEVPDNTKNLISQRDRWARGFTETIFKNRNLFLNFKYGILGWFTFPYYVLFEWLTPFIEIIGFFWFLYGIAMGSIEWIVLSQVFLLYYTTGASLNIVTLIAESSTGGHYKSPKNLWKLMGVALIEPFFYHWLNSFIYIWGNIRLIFGVRNWGKLERRGIKK